MKNVVEILTENGIELSDEQANAIDAAVRENYKTRAEFDQKMAKYSDAQKRIKELEGEIAKRDEAIESMSGNAEELEAYKKQVAEYQQREAEAKEKAEQAAKIDAFRPIFDEALAGREFANDIMKDSIFDKAFAGCANTNAATCKAFIDSMTAELDGVWKNPQQDPKKMPIPGKKDDGEEPVKSPFGRLF